MTPNYTPEENKLRELTGGDYFSQEFMDKLKSLNLTVKEANIVIDQIKNEIITGECCLEAIPIRLNYLLNQIAPEVIEEKLPSKELIAKKELIFLLNQKDNRTSCPNCQTQLFLTDVFCYKCGAKNTHLTSIKSSKDDDLNLDEIYCAKLYEKYPLDFKYAYVCFLRYLDQHPEELDLASFNNIDVSELKKQAIKDNYIANNVLTHEARKFLKENEYLIYYLDNNLNDSISLEKYESLFKKSKVTDSIYDVLYRYYVNIANESVVNNQWHQYRTAIGHIINISVDNISDLKLLKLHLKYFILEANDDYNPTLEFNKSRNDLIASLKLDLNELQEIFDEAWDEVKIPSYTVSKKDTFKKLILVFNNH